jgi:fructokinase
MTDPTFAVCGEALFDLFTTGASPTGFSIDARIGGSPLNVAIGLARLGRCTAFVGALGRDALGQRLLRALLEEDVDTRWVQRPDAPTTLGLVALDESGHPSYAFHGDHGADRQLDADTLPPLPDTVRALHVGSYAMVVEPVASAQRRLIDAARGRRLVAYDLNLRTRVEPSLERWRDTLAWMLPRCDLLKMSDEDAAELYPGLALADAAARWHAAGAGWVVVTHGAAGATAWTPHGRVEVPGLPVTVADTVGAGDTFQAALLAWLDEHDRLSPAAMRGLAVDGVGAALRFATQAAAITCSRRGADLPRRAELPGR